MAKNKVCTISDMYCVECGQKGIALPRRKAKQREPGHLKRLWCCNCKKEVNHAEVRPFGDYNFEDFIEEFICGRFIDGNRIPLSELKDCGNNSCRYNKKGKCWNANNSFACEIKNKED